MQKYFIHIIVILIYTSSSILKGQNFTDDCILIDFESIPQGELEEGMSIFDQYSDVYGVTFLLDNGQPPKLAKIGPPRTAFASQWGDDNPKPGEDIGQYFLTDDGVLGSNLNNIPLNVNFTNPMDSVSGCILDMDFGERFIVEAFGEFGDQIFIDTIFAGDIGTGDGEATCWGFRLDDCEGTIYSVKLDGYRETAGGFGLGLDNFAFCKFGATINLDFVINQEDIICGGQSGSISIENISGENLQYSFNNGPFTTTLIEDNLPEGKYEILVINEFGCQEDFEISIDDIPEPEIMVVIESSTTCGLDNGTIEMQVQDGFGQIEYTLDGSNFQTSNVFNDLPPGDYSVFVVDALGCVDFATTTILPSEGPIFTQLLHEDASCDLQNGMVTVGGSSSMSSVQYSVNGSEWQNESMFENLPVGDHTVSIIDAEGCRIDSVINIEMHPLIEIRDIIETQPECLLNNGTVTVTYEGGVGEALFSIDGGLFQESPVFADLLPGTYTITIMDEKGCTLPVEAVVPPYICPVYVGNIFAPNNNGYNEIFPVITEDDYQADILTYDIYDRWGELIYSTENFDIHDRTHYWDGTFNGKMSVLGVYVYLIQVRHFDGSIEFLSGDVTLIL